MSGSGANFTPSDDVANDRVDRKLPVASALLIRRVFAQKTTSGVVAPCLRVHILKDR
jgi:hypothetical protein